jgi:hypothetical protein
MTPSKKHPSPFVRWYCRQFVQAMEHTLWHGSSKPYDIEPMSEEAQQDFVSLLKACAEHKDKREAEAKARAENLRSTLLAWGSDYPGIYTRDVTSNFDFTKAEVRAMAKVLLEEGEMKRRPCGRIYTVNS